MSSESDLNRETIAKRTLAERIAEKTGLGQTQTLQVIQHFLDEIIDELAAGNRLEFRDFGVLKQSCVSLGLLSTPRRSKRFL